MFLSYPPDEKSARLKPDPRQPSKGFSMLFHGNLFQATLVHVALDGGLAGTRQREGLTDVDYTTQAEKLA